MIKIKKEIDKQYIVYLIKIKKINRLFTDLLNKELRELLEQPENEIYFNLNDIRFIDSEGFRMLKDVNAYAQKHNTKLYLCNISNELYELFELLSLEKSFRICQKAIEKEKILLEVEI